MNSLFDLHTFLDQSNFDPTHLSAIQQAYKDLLENLDPETSVEVFRLADLEWQALNIRKSFDYKANVDEGRLDGLSWQMAGAKTLENGEETPLYWPDVTALTNEDFIYFEEIWQQSKNDFIKSEFGLLVYFGKRTSSSKGQQFAKVLFNVLMNLVMNYEHKIVSHEDYKFYYAYFLNTIKTVTGIAFRSKLLIESKQLANYLKTMHDNTIFFEKGLISLYAEVTSLIADHFNSFKKLISLDDLISTNLTYINQLKGINLWAALSLIQQSINILDKQNKDNTYLILEKAQVYEKLADDALMNNPAAESSFIVDAMKYYKSGGDRGSFVRMQARYNEQRGKIQLTDFEQEMPSAALQQIHDNINTTIQDGDKTEIIIHLLVTPWYSKYDDVKKQSIEMRALSPFLSILPVSVLDKYGNVIARYTDPIDILKYSIISSYNTNFQLGTYVMVNFILKAVESKKLDYESVIDYLSTTWVNNPIPLLSQNKEISIYPINTIRPVIKRFFIEVDLYLKGNIDEMDLVTLTDSMTLRIEQLLRQFCLKAGIPTFKRKKGNEDIMMEKTLDELLAELENNPELIPIKTVNFNEDHRQMIKFVMTEKGGWNLRNEIAHGLMDFQEYTIEKPVVLLSIILKLSGYQFVENKEEKNL